MTAEEWIKTNVNTDLLLRKIDELDLNLYVSPTENVTIYNPDLYSSE